MPSSWSGRCSRCWKILNANARKPWPRSAQGGCARSSASSRRRCCRRPSSTGFALAFARAIGEYGSIVFISSNLPFKSEIAPYLIVMRLEQFDYARAMSLAVVLLVFSFRIVGGDQSHRTVGEQVRKIAWPESPKTIRRWSRQTPARHGRIAAGQWTLISVAMVFVSCSSVLPLVNVFVQAFSEGWDVYWKR